MIFVTVGSMFPFDRLIRLMDAWAGLHPDAPVFAQIGTGTFEPTVMKWTRRLTPVDFEETVRSARLIVAHAGMGSVITASDYGTPIVLLPRIASQGEHTTDHQVDTARWLGDRSGIYVANPDGSDLHHRIDEARKAGIDGEMLPKSANPAFLKKIREAVGG